MSLQGFFFWALYEDIVDAIDDANRLNDSVSSNNNQRLKPEVEVGPENLPPMQPPH